MLKFLMLIAIGGFVYYKFQKKFPLKNSIVEQVFKMKRGPMKESDLVEDPFCHTLVPQDEALKVSHEGKEHFFCSQKCADQYKLAQNSSQ